MRFAKDSIIMNSDLYLLFSLSYRTNGFSIITANRVYSFTADTTIEITNWVDGEYRYNALFELFVSHKN